jgi:SAM-dependent methyltransferase
MDIRGHVLEIGSDLYTGRFGENRVVKREILHVSEQRPGITIIGDLTDAGHIHSNLFDCIILTQTLQFIFDIPSALRTVCRILKPGGVALVTVPGISNISRYDMDRWGHYWSFTTKSIALLFENNFSNGNFEIDAFGNVLTATAFLQGISAEELCKKELDFHDPDYEVLITVRAEKALASK